MRTDKFTAPRFLDLGGLLPTNQGRQVHVVIKRGMLRVQFLIQNPGELFSLAVAAAAVALCALSATGP